MRWIFWVSAFFVFYTYLGYPGLLYLRSRFCKKSIGSGQITPTISILIAARNEATHIATKLQNLLLLNYPKDRIEVIVISDGSTDETNGILACYGQSIKPVFLEQHGGKAGALNAGVQVAKNEIVVFTDARQKIETDALRYLVSNFADPAVGCASGELMLGAEAHSGTEGLGLYWRLEKKIREWESASGSVVGATGAFYAVRRELLVELPQSTILDDVYTPMQVVKAGFRVIFDSSAKAWDVPLANQANEFRRKVRTLSGNYQLVQLAPWLIGLSNPIWLRFVSHKLLRLLSPFLLAMTLLTAAASPGGGYKAAALVQLLLWASAIMAIAFPRFSAALKVPNLALSFFTLNAAAFMAFVNFVRGKNDVWVR